MDKQLLFATYNSHGHGPGRCDYIQKLCNRNDFVFVQEHCLLDSQSQFFENKLAGIRAHSVSVIKRNHYSGIEYGKVTVVLKLVL